MILRYLMFRYELGFTHEQARALADADYVVLQWLKVEVTP